VPHPGRQYHAPGRCGRKRGRGRTRLEQSIADGSALEKLAQFVRAQGGDERQVHDPSTLPEAAVKLPVRAPQDGFVAAIRADSVGLASLQLGGGRATKESEIDLAVGIVLEKKIGDAVRAGRPWP
jgi:pyrimidine-nucleoside phosphorylase